MSQIKSIRKRSCAVDQASKNKVEVVSSPDQPAGAERRCFQPHYRQGGATTERQWLRDTIKRIVIIDVRFEAGISVSYPPELPPVSCSRGEGVL